MFLSREKLNKPPRLARPVVVEVEVLLDCAKGGVDRESSSATCPNEPFVEDLPRAARRVGGTNAGEDLPDCADVAEFLRAAGRSGAANMIEDAWRAVCEAFGSGGR